jgi:hypothetical protein
MPDLDLPPAAGVLLDAWIAGAREILGDRLVAVRLHGGLAIGDFAPGWSDVDVCAVLAGAPTEEDLRALGALGAGLHHRFVIDGEAGWWSGQAVEALLLTREVLAGRSGPVVDVEGSRGEWRPLPELPAFERLWASRFGRTLQGEDLAVTPPRHEDLRARLEGDLRIVRTADGRSPIWHAGILAWMARSLAFWCGDALLGKTEALRREQERDSPLAEGFAVAAAMRREGSGACAERRDDLRAAFRACAPVVDELLRGSV